MNAAWTGKVRIASWVIVALGMLNFVVFAAVAECLGGDALNGKVEGEHYYVYSVRTEYGHKVYTEVSERVFNYSRWHFSSVLVTWPLVMASAFALQSNQKALGRKLIHDNR